MARTALWVAALTSGVVGMAQAGSVPDYQQNSSWFTDGQRVVANKAARPEASGTARNVILFVGDGMGISTVTAARILAGQRNGNTGEENQLSFERFPHSALVKTYNTNQQTPDSAGTMTAMVTGVKSKAGVLSVAQDTARGDCAASRQVELTTLFELAEQRGKATGVVSTARLTHATPAATYAHSPERNWESNDALPAEAVASGCKDIAAQFVDLAPGNGIEVAFGGGRRHFLPAEVEDIEGSSGRRTDGRDLTAEWRARHPQGRYVEDQAGFDALDATTQPVLGLFNSSHMQYEADRGNDIAGEPSLSQMTAKAIDILAANNDGNGYVLVVESGRIDHAHHAGNAFNALNENIEYAAAVQAAIDRVDTRDTLVMVTADHSHVFTIAGYPKRGNPILGKVVSVGAQQPAQALDSMPFTTLGYANGLGFADLGAQTDADARYALPADTGRKNLQNVDTQSPGFHQEALVPLSAETHAGEDITVHAIGPGSQWLAGVIEQNVIFHIINDAAALGARGY